MSFNRKNINFKAGLDTSEVATGAQKIEGHFSALNKKLSGITSSFKGLGVAIAAAFSIQQIGQFTQDSVRLASEAEGVKEAFDRLNDPNLLAELRKATKNTVSDLKLMQLSVQAKNFKLPLEQLGTYLAFAQKKAKETGQSVDFLVESIITGLGRESKLIIDNLGISSAELSKRMAEGKTMAQALGDIIREEMPNAGEQVLTAKERFDQMTTAIENAKVAIGRELIPMLANLAQKITPAIIELIKYGRAAFGTMSSADIQSTEAKAAAIAKTKTQEQLQRALNQEAERYNELVEKQSFVITDAEYRERIIFKARINAFREELDRRKVLFQSYLTSINAAEKKTLQGDPTPPIQLTDSQIEEMRKKLAEANKVVIEEYQSFKIEFENMLNKEDGIPSVINTMAQSMTNPEALGRLRSSFLIITDEFRNLTDSMNTAIEQYLESAIVDVFSRLGEGLVGAARDVENWGNQMLASFGGFLQQMGAMIISYAFAMDAFKKAFKDPVTAIAAGAALVAIGAAIKKTHENKMGGSGGGGSAGVPSSSFNQGYNFESRLDGYDLVLVSDRNQRLRTRRG
jgi:hypothetical protein